MPLSYVLAAGCGPGFGSIVAASSLMYDGTNAPEANTAEQVRVRQRACVRDACNYPARDRRRRRETGGVTRTPPSVARMGTNLAPWGSLSRAIGWLISRN